MTEAAWYLLLHATPLLVFVLSFCACLGWGLGMAVRRVVARAWRAAFPPLPDGPCGPHCDHI